MARYLPYRVVNGTCAVGVCDRCRSKTYLGALVPDGDAPGLRVCRDCADDPDPYLLPARKTERLDVSHPRPDEDLV